MKKTAKILAVILSALMLICMLPTVAFAAETGSNAVAISSFAGGTVKINASNADDSFKLYKVIDITYNEAANTVTYDFTEAAKEYNATLTNAPSIETYQNWSDDSTNLKNYLGGFAVYVKTNNVSAPYSGKATDSVCTISNVALGQYLVLGAGSATGAYVYQLMTATFKPDSELKVNETVTLSSKASKPEIEKKADDTQVAIGDTVKFTVTVDIPTYPEGATNRSFKVVDTMSKGLEFVETESVKADNDDLTATDDYTFTESGSLTWNFNFDSLAGHSKLTIVYTAKITNDIKITTGAENNAKIEYSNDPYGDGTYDDSESKVKVYTYELKITKTGEKDVALSGVEFELYAADKTTKIGETYTTDENGVITIKGLDAGTYYLKETKTADGYILPTEMIKVEISDSDKDGKLDDNDSGTLEITVTNSKGDYNLPQTGGIGTWVFTGVGVCLMLGAVALLFVYKKKSAQSK